MSYFPVCNKKTVSIVTIMILTAKQVQKNTLELFTLSESDMTAFLLGLIPCHCHE